MFRILIATKPPCQRLFQTPEDPRCTRVVVPEVQDHVTTAPAVDPPPALRHVPLRGRNSGVDVPTEIDTFENSFDDILQTVSLSLVTTQRVAQSPSLVIVDQPAVVKTVCHFLAADCGLIYNEGVNVYGDFILHKYGHVEQSDVPGPADDNEETERLIRYWHTENLVHPLRHVPGNPWHKFFGNLQPGPIVRPDLFRERKPQPYFRLMFPTTITWVQPEIRRDYDNYREIFEKSLRFPGPRLPEAIRVARTGGVQCRLSHYFRGWKRTEEATILCLKDMSEIPCPEYDLLGLSGLEALNAEVNAPDLAGIALLGEDIPDVPIFLEAESSPERVTIYLSPVCSVCSVVPSN
ncbi:hypothetical protein CHGG_03581 [Chaetomium globosum CBS 148.51]|uniref:Uncharacterized protein n=1 Tax=Chaetomium globosum (strain ATCC 6205 / CBS 148.51 / DSM 1962 / NBRC 6347 / NRRL 1970) TaxID=306901 RepID=Q2H873_CHAGB|nr:uncharacterized protein CHGG_03581 [Chaetomium globosum CBS 148.51]EAQ91646.1 hypothetical protein CHGG_03581 [Chaetomium globosum CBS 148.51]